MTPRWDHNANRTAVGASKSRLSADDLRDRESAKIRCGEAHFTELAAQFIKAADLGDPMAKC